MLEVKVTNIDGKEIEHMPLKNFDDLDIKQGLRDKLGSFKEPTAIQSYCWPIGMQKKDLVAVAETGSGKTWGYTVPMVSILKFSLKSKKRTEKRGERVYKPALLVIAPTRELAMQIYETVNIGMEGMGFANSTVCVYGGVPRKDQLILLSKKNPMAIVGTPGRIDDFIEMGTLDLSEIQGLVLDEADRILDVGFEPVIRKITSKMPPKGKRIVHMFSATWPDSVKKLAIDYLEDPTLIFVNNSSESKLAGGTNISQTIQVVNPKDKPRQLEQYLSRFNPQKDQIIVFVLYKREAPFVSKYIQNLGWSVTSIHGDKNQAERFKALESFKLGLTKVLVATDVAARGLDIPNVTAVLNYTFPLTIEDYVHRIGRTGRAGASGKAHTLFTEENKAHAGDLILVLRNSNTEPPSSLLKFGTVIKKKQHNIYGSHFKEIDPMSKPKHIKFE